MAFKHIGSRMITCLFLASGLCLNQTKVNQDNTRKLADGYVFQLKDIEKVLDIPKSVTLNVRSKSGNVLVYLKTKEQDPVQILTWICKGANCEFKHSGNTWEVFQTSDQKKANEIDERLLLQKTYSWNDSNSSLTEPDFTKIQADAIRESIKSIGDLSIPENQKRLNSLKRLSPSNRLADRLIHKLPNEMFGLFAGGQSRFVLSSNPNSKQRAFPFEVSGDIAQFDRERSLWNSSFAGFEIHDGESTFSASGRNKGFLIKEAPIAKIILRIESYPYPTVFWSMKGISNQGDIVFSSVGFANQLPGESHPIFSVKEGLMFSERSKDFYSVTRIGFNEHERKKATRDLLAESSSFDPLNEWVREGLGLVTKNLKNVIVVLPDIGSYSQSPQNFLKDLTIGDKVQKVEDATAMIFRPIRMSSYFDECIDRSPVTRTLKKFLAENNSTLIERTSVFQALPRESKSSDFFVRMASLSKVNWLGSFPSEADGRIIGTIPSEWLNRGGVWNAQYWPQELRNEVEYWLYNYRDLDINSKFDRKSANGSPRADFLSEATEAFPNGLPANASLSITKSIQTEFAEQRSSLNGAMEFINAETLGFRLKSQRGLRDFDCPVALSDTWVYKIEVTFAAGFTMSFEGKDRNIVSKVRHIAELPEKLRKSILN